jgi:outer membrane immunogenic protein
VGRLTHEAEEAFQTYSPIDVLRRPLKLLRHSGIEGFPMKMKLWSGVAVLASIAAGVGAANAADLSTPPVYKAPVYKAPPIVSDWSGFYIGAHGGYGWGESSYVTGGGSPFAALALPANISVKQGGGVGGGHVGYNWQFGTFVVGVEGDFDGANITGTDTTNSVTFNTNELASIRGRAGYTVTPDVLVYGTGGAGWANTEVSSASVSDNINQWGWVAGGGVEYKFYGHWIARAEYLHYGFDATTTTPDFGPVTVKSIDVVRGGLSYKF